MKLAPFIPDPKFKIYDLRHERNYKIPVNYGHGLRWKDAEGRTFESRVTKFQNGKRVARLEERNLLFSMGASHYYADIKFSSPANWDLANDRCLYMAGYGPERKAIENYISSATIEAERRLTKLEKDISGERLGKIGDWTYRFNSAAEARAGAIAIFKKRFAPGWVLIDEDGKEVAAT